MKTVSNVVARGILASGSLDGFSEGALFEATGLHRHEILAPEGRIDARRHFRLLRCHQAQRPALRLPAPTMALFFGGHHLLAAVCGNAPSLREALRLLVRFRPLVGECDELVLHEEGEGVRLTYHSESGSAEIGSISSLFNFLLVGCLVRHYLPGVSLDQSVTLERLSLPELRVARQRLECPVLLGGGNGYRLASTALDRPYAGYNPALSPFQWQAAEQALQALRPVARMSERLRGLIQQRLLLNVGDGLEGGVGQSALSEALNLSRWTLMRKLQEEGVSFSQIHNEVRREEALRRLRTPHDSLLAISQALGFANQSSFTRFFREQVGCLPSHYRRRFQG